MKTPYSDDKGVVGFIKSFVVAMIRSRHGVLAEFATLLRFQPGTKGFHRRYERLVSLMNHLKQAYKEEVSSHLKTLPGLTLGIFDDTTIKKAGRCFEGEGVHHDHITGKNYNGFKVCSTAIYRGGKTAVVETTFSSKQESKIDLFKESFNSLCHEELAPDVFLFDTWYSLKPVLKLIEEHCKLYVTRLRSNRVTFVDDECLSLKLLAINFSHHQYCPVRVHGRTYWVIDIRLNLSGLGEQRVIVSKDSVHARPVFLTTNSETFSTKFVLILYLKRFQIELFFKDAKQFLNLETFQCRTKEKWGLHFLFVQLVHWFIQRRNSISKVVRGIRESLDKIQSYIN